MSKLMTQVEMVTSGDDPETLTSMTTWLEKDERIKVNAKFSLKDDPRTWTVVRVFDLVELPFHQLKANRGWDNNNYDKHKGLGL